MKSLSYAQNLAFQYEYWNYLTSEKCDCTESHHVRCHKEMLAALERLDEWDFDKRFLHARIVERMKAFIAFTGNTQLRNFAASVIERIEFIEKHRMDCSPRKVRAPRAKKPKPPLLLVTASQQARA